MGKVTTNISFDKEFLNKLKSDHNACVYIRKEIYHLGLHPFHTTDLASSIKGILNEKIAKYDKKLGGILLGYQNIQLLDNVGAVSFDTLIHTTIVAEFYIFTPDVGQVLNGIVNKKSKDHIGCLVHKTFNVSLPKPENCEDWLGHSAQLGQEIQFEITFTNLDGRLPYIKGRILSVPSDDSGFSTSEEQAVASNKQNSISKFSDSEASEKPTKKKKRKRDDLSFDDIDEKGGSEVIEKPTKKKKHRREETSFDDVDDDKSNKKKKHKKRELEDVEAETLAVNCDTGPSKNKHKHKSK